MGSQEIQSDDYVLNLIPQKPAFISKLGLLNKIRRSKFSYSNKDLTLLLVKLSKSKLIEIGTLSNQVLGIKDERLSRV